MGYREHLETAQRHYEAAQEMLSGPTPEQHLQLATVAALLAVADATDAVDSRVAYLASVMESDAR